MSIFKLKRWDPVTSFLHTGLAFFVTLQLIIALTMKQVKGIFIYHEICGFIIFFIVIIHWTWSCWGQKLGFKHLFPWNKAGMLAVSQDLKMLIFNKQLPTGGPRAGLPGFIHGLGFLAVTGMALTGVTMFIGWKTSVNVQLIKHWHSFIANFVWIYWFGHVAMAIVHKIFDRS